MILEIKDVAFGFSPEKQILNNISIKLFRGKIYALMGSNGSGKTTLFNIISGFINTNKGLIVYENKILNNSQPFLINQHGIGRSFQDMRLVTKLTVKENILLAMKNNPTDHWYNSIFPHFFHKSTTQKLVLKAEELIKHFFLSDVKYALAGEISYGQQKLLSLACCVANEASLLLLDEAVAGIQPEYRKKIASLILQLKEAGKTVFLIEHNTDFIAELADTIFFLHEGKISTYEDMKMLRNDNRVMEAYI